MPARFACSVLLLPTLLSLFAQQTAPAPPLQPRSAQSAPVVGATELHTGTQLVFVDVVVQDSKGQPVHDLPRSAFQLTESKAPQTVTSFEEHSNAAPVKMGPELPRLPPGTFTDYTPAPVNGALNVLLVDALNTPMQDQSFLRLQLQQYVKKLAPGTRIAIFGLNTRLYFLQGFTADPTTLRDAVDHKLIPRASNLMDDPTTGAADTSLSDAAADAGLSEVSSNLAQFETIQQSYRQQLRIQYTLDAFNTLGHYLAGLPGRKNVIWFSGSFPIDILPDPSLDNVFATMEVNDEEFRETTNLLTRAQVAVYPVDARGLMNNPAFSAANSGRKYARNPSAFSDDVSKFNASQASEHMAMEQMATDTGGRAFYNTNGLADAAATAISSGSNYYTLAYTPTNRKPHGEYREIRLSLNNDAAARGLKLYYRHGYYADDPAHPAHQTESAAPNAAQAAAVANPATSAYLRAAMSRGAPTPSDILFKVRVLPVSTTTDTTLLPGDTPDGATPFKGPYRRYNIDYAALGADLRLATQADGNRAGAIEFTTFLFDSDGKLLNAIGKTVQVNVTPDRYKVFQRSGVGLHLEISAPAKGESFLRIAVHDVAGNRFGVVEVPTSTVSRLAPPPPAPAAAAPSSSATPGASPAAGAPATPAAPH